MFAFLHQPFVPYLLFSLYNWLPSALSARSSAAPADSLRARSFSIVLSRCVSENVFCNSHEALSHSFSRCIVTDPVAQCVQTKCFPAPSCSVTRQHRSAFSCCPRPSSFTPIPAPATQTPLLSHCLAAVIIRVQLLEVFLAGYSVFAFYLHA